MNDPKSELYTYDLSGTTWRKSSASGAENNCVEIASLPGVGKVLRDSKNPDYAPLRFTNAEWAAFRRGVLDGIL